MKAFLLAAGRGTRFLPVTELLPKPLFPFLNEPLARGHLARLRAAGVEQAGLNLHHRGRQIVRELSQRTADFPQLRFFEEPVILGTAGALRNAADFLAGEDFVVVNADTAIAPDLPALARRHRVSGCAATLLLVENREPARFTPVAVEGDRVTSFGGQVERPFLYTGVCMLSPRLLARIPPGEASLVSEVWVPLLERGPGQIGWLLHEGSFTDLGRPRDFLRATLEALERGGPFPHGAGTFDASRQLLTLSPTTGFEARHSVLGDVRIGSGAVLDGCAVWSGASVGERVRLKGVLVAGGEVPEGAIYEDVLLWGEPTTSAGSFPL